MKIAIIRKEYTFHGGSEQFSQKLVLHLVNAGYEVHIFAIDWKGDLPSKGIFFHKVPAITFNSFLRDLTFALSCFFMLRKQRKSFDIIQSHDKTLYQDIYRAGDGCHIEWLRQRWKRATVLNKLSIILNPYHWLILSMERIIFKGYRFKRVIAISELVKKNIIEHYCTDERLIEVIYNGVDLEQFHPQNRNRYREEIRKKHSIDEDAFVVLFVGSGFERKGVGYLLKAVELVSRHLTVLIVGKGPEKKLKNLIKKQKVIFCGTQKEIHKYYASADVFVFPTMYEPFGNVHLEALASGLPVITTKQCGASEIIEEGKQGFVVNEPENIHEIAEKVLYLMNKEVNRNMSSDAKKLMETFSFENHMKKMSELYNSIRTESGNM